MGNSFSSLFRPKEAPNRGEEEPGKPDETSADRREDKNEDERPPPATADDTSFAAQLMRVQNEYRMKHGVRALELDENMCKEAQRWANEIASKNRLQHADTQDGENLAFAGPTLDAKQAADMWYKEISDYDFRNPGFRGGTGHFTQLVWKDSEKFGGAVAKGTNGMYAVGRYRPAGNITNEGQFEANVFPAK